MNIQQNLNAMLTMGAVAHRASNRYKYGVLKQQGKKLEKFATSGENLDLSGEQQLALAQKYEGVKQEQAFLKPTANNVLKYKQASDWKGVILDAMESEAAESVGNEIDAKQNQTGALKDRISFLESTIRDARDNIQSYLDKKNGGNK